MIADALEFIRQELRLALAVPSELAIAGPPMGHADDHSPRGLYLCAFSVRDEQLLRQAPNVDGVSHGAEPPLHLAFDLLCAFDFDQYTTSLAHVTSTIAFFRSRPWSSSTTQVAPDATPFPATLESIAVDMVDMSLEQQHHLWSMLGCSYLPSVVVRVRLVESSTPALSDHAEVPSDTTGHDLRVDR